MAELSDVELIAALERDCRDHHGQTEGHRCDRLDFAATVRRKLQLEATLRELLSHVSRTSLCVITGHFARYEEAARKAFAMVGDLGDGERALRGKGDGT